MLRCELRDRYRIGAGWDVLIFNSGLLIFSQQCGLESEAHFIAMRYRRELMQDGLTDSQNHPPAT